MKRELMNNPDFNLTGFREVKMLSTETGFAHLAGIATTLSLARICNVLSSESIVQIKICTMPSREKRLSLLNPCLPSLRLPPPSLHPPLPSLKVASYLAMTTKQSHSTPRLPRRKYLLAMTEAVVPSLKKKKFLTSNF